MSHAMAPRLVALDGALFGLPADLPTRGAVTPIGGVALAIGWILIGTTAPPPRYGNSPNPAMAANSSCRSRGPRESGA